MSRSFSGFVPKPYIGIPYSQAWQYGPGAKVVPLNFDWAAYGASSANPNIIVGINLQQNISGPAPVIDRAVTVYIDNTGSNCPVYFVCADTGFVATVQPHAAGWYPIFTNQLIFNVAIAGVVTGLVPKTRVFISNSFIPPYTDPELQTVFPLYLGSPTVQRTNVLAPGFGPPALGDQITGATLLGQNPAGTLSPFAELQGNFAIGTELILTNIIVNTSALVLSGRCRVALLDSTAGAFVADIPVDIGLSFNSPGMNLRRDATHAYFLQMIDPATSGFISMHLIYTANDADQL